MGRGWLHDHVLLGPFVAAALLMGFVARREFRVNVEGHLGVIDLLIERGDWRIAVEAERTVDRVLKDLRKAEAIHADLLVILVSHTHLGQAVRRKFIRHDVSLRRRNHCIWISPPRLALQRLTTFMSFMTSRSSESPNVTISNRPVNMPAQPDRQDEEAAS